MEEKKNALIEQFSKRRTDVLEVYNKAKGDLENLNKDIQSQIDANNVEVSRIAEENKQLESIKSSNKSTIKVFEKLFK